MNYRILVQYDGSRYKGWQVQKSTDATIQGKLQMVLESLVGYPVEVIGSGRTDAGVHALGQVANFHLKEEFDEEKLLWHLNRYLPEDIAVVSVEACEERFHSRYHATKKTYRYRIHTSMIPNVFERKYVYTYPDAGLNVERMREAASFLVGTHDFAGFCGNRKMKKSTVRTIEDIEITKEAQEILLDFTGDGFLQNMIRIMVGTLIEVGNGSREASSIAEVFEAKDRSLAGYTAPPQGLTLMRVCYGKMDRD